MNQLPSIPVLKTLHWVIHRILIRAGYRWELRRSGELGLGLWRKTLRKSPSRGGPTPRRWVLIPGFGDTPLSWLMVLSFLKPLLGDRFDEVVIFDFPGFSGFLSRERAFHSMDLLQSAVGDALDTLKPHTILGHSLGGWLAASYAAACGRGERPATATVGVERSYGGPDTLILCNPAGIHESEEAKREWERKFRSTMQEGFHRLRPHLFAKEPSWFKLIAGEFSRFVAQEEVRQFTDSVREEHLMNRKLGDVRAKAWVLWGDRDTLAPTSCARVWRDGLTAAWGGAKVILIRGAGHSPQVEKPAVTAAVIAQIFKDRVPHRAGQRWWSVLTA